MQNSVQISGFDFAEGSETAEGISCDWICSADNEVLEKHEIWLSLAFPARKPEDVAKLSPKARANIIRLAQRLKQYLQQTESWKHPGALERMPMAQILASLNAVDLDDYAEQIYGAAVHLAHPSESVRGYWDEALGLAPES